MPTNFKAAPFRLVPTDIDQTIGDGGSYQRKDVAGEGKCQRA